MVKNLSVNTGDVRNVGLIPELGRSLEVGNGNPLCRASWKISNGRRGAFLKAKK